jgi:putative toxin-antitoxin system antitoxin component (TIGR02293 family)
MARERIEMKTGIVAETATSHAYSHFLSELSSHRNDYVRLLGLEPQETLSLIGLVEQGFSYQELENLRRNTRLSTEEFFEVIQVAPRTLARRKATSRLLPEESDRLLRTSRVFGKALDLFEGDLDGALHWLRTPQPALGSATPLHLSRTEVGAHEVETLMGRLEHGVFS